MDLTVPTLVLIFIFGLCLGSFLNVLIYRLNAIHLESVLKVLGGRSFCDYCKKKILWYDNIPLLSFILLRGKCRLCHSPISWQYPLVELTTAIFTVLVVYHRLTYDTIATIYFLLIIYALIVIFVSDLRYQVIPDQIVYPAIGVNLIYNFLSYFPFTEVFLGYLLAGLAAGGFFFLLFLITKGKGMGLGDVKLAFLMGLFLGFPKIIVALYIAFLTGALIGVILVLVGKKKFGEHIPFGPFLVGSTILSLFYGEAIWQKIIEGLL